MNLTQVQDEKPALLMLEHEGKMSDRLFLNEGELVPKLRKEINEAVETDWWYLDNGASNHMTGNVSKFK